MNNSITEFFKAEVYPRLDAVESGLLNYLKPRAMSSNGSYVLECPACGEAEAFYYPFRTGISCNRKKGCPSPFTSLWDALANHGMANKDIVTSLCKAVGVEPPSNRQNDNRPGQASPRTALSPGRAIIQVTQHLAAQNPEILAKFQQARGYSDTDMKEMKFGVYTTVAEVHGLLASVGISKEVARDKGYLSFDDDKPDLLRSGMEGRIVGYWPHSDGDARLWGRIPVGPGTKVNPKYRFSKFSSKDTPYLFSKRRNSVLVCVEGTLDAWALQLLEQWGCAIGQSSINSAQAAYIASQGITEVAHMVDGDHAGYEGALSSIRACEAVGITLGVITLGAGMDDADAMRKAGNGELLKSLIVKRINAGEYLARYCAAQLEQPTPDLRSVARIRHTAEFLTPASKRRWIDFSKSLGIHIDEDVEAIRVLAGLLSSGFSISEGLSFIQRQKGIIISITKEALNG